MNTRIKELEALATEIEHSHGAFGEYEKYERLNVQKFAELIIKECQFRVTQYINDCGEVASIPDTVIMEYFGIEQ